MLVPKDGSAAHVGVDLEVDGGWRVAVKVQSLGWHLHGAALANSCSCWLVTWYGPLAEHALGLVPEFQITAFGIAGVLAVRPQVPAIRALEVAPVGHNRFAVLHGQQGADVQLSSQQSCPRCFSAVGNATRKTP